MLAPIARTLGASADELGALQEVYGPAGVVPMWLAGGAPTPQADEARAMLHAAAQHGLDPAAYLVGALAPSRVGESEEGPVEAPAEARSEALAEYDVALSLGVLRYMRHLHLGRVDPRAVGLRLETWSEPHDFPALLRQGVAAGRAVPAVESLAPPFAVYARLAAALPRYRALAASRDPEVPAFERAVRPEEPYAGAHALGLHLAARGDLAPIDVPPADAARYEGALVDAVRRFQTRHGLTPDGVLGARTVAAARMPALARVRQIEVALERLRWLPDLGRRRLVVVNIPMFRAWAWDTLGPSPVPAFATNVIVGKAMRTETPVFVETMDHVIFRPYWNVPRSILRDEVLPAIRRDAGYLTRQQMEVVDGAGDDARSVGLGPGTLEALAAGTLRVRQRPGPHNALGLVKFVFPNRDSVYMHGTPTPSLFARDRRDLSHGCIRVADPSGLARWVLGGVDGWDADRIAQAMQAHESTRVDLAAPIDVVLFYMTAAVWPEDDAVHFADDIYGHDAALERALATVTSAR
jgi:murein L,D-transpeptidase YcbB/YkuD